MGIFDKVMNKIGFIREEKMAGFMTTEIESEASKTIESGKVSEYKDFIDAYRQLPWLYAGATALAIAAPKPKLRIYKEVAGKGNEEITGEELNRLIKRPNDFLSYRELIQITVINMVITGNQFWNLVGTSEDGVISSSNKPVEIWWVKPEQIEIKAHGTKFIEKYEFVSKTAKPKDLEPSEIIHFKLANPDSYFRGLGSLEAAKNTAIMEFNAVAYNKNFLANDATPFGLFSSPDKLTKTQMKQHKRAWEETHKGSGKAGKIGYVWGGMEFKEIGKTPKDAQFIEMRKMNREEILATLGVPPSVVGLLEYANYSNMEVQQKKFWEDAVMPILNLIADKLTLNLAPHFNEDYWLEFDYSNIKVLQEDEKQKAEMGKTLVDGGIMSRNEIRDRLYNLAPRVGLDQIYQPMMLIPIEGSDKEQGAKQAKQIEQKSKESPSFWQDETKKKVLWENFVKRVEMKEKPLIEKMETYLKDQANRVREKLSKLKDKEEIRSDKIFNEDKEVKLFFLKFKARYLNAFQLAGEAGMDVSEGKLFNPDLKQILKEEPRFILTPELEAALEALIMESGTNINRTTLEKIMTMIRQGEVEGWTIEELTQNINNKLTDLSISRSRLISRTEMAKIENFGQLEGYKQSEFVERKGWLCSFVPDSRDEHMAADYQYSANPISLNESFIVGGEELQYPGDPSGSPGNVCNCLCSTYPEVREF